MYLVNMGMKILIRFLFLFLIIFLLNAFASPIIISSIYIVAGTIDNPEPGIFVGNPFDETNSSLVINEFVYSPTGDGNEWVEVLNKTDSDVGLAGWTIKDEANHNLTLSGTVPAHGILVFENSGTDFLNNTAGNGDGDTIYLKNGETVVDKLTYQKQANGTIINNTSSVAAVSAGQSLYRTSDGGSSWNVGTPSKGWFNQTATFDCSTPIVLPPTLSSISTCLASQNIAANLSSLANPSATEVGDNALYFEKSIDGKPASKIKFNTSLNLTNNNIATLLKTLGTKLNMGNGLVGLDASTATAMKNAVATLTIYDLATLGYTGTSAPNITVKDDSGNIIDSSNINYPILSNISFADINADSKTDLTFSADHFSSYQINPTLAQVTSVTNPTSDSTPNYTFSSDVAGTITYLGSCSSSTTSAIVGNNTITFNNLADEVYSNCQIKVTDGAGYYSILNVSSFTVDTTSLTSSSTPTSGSSTQGLSQAGGSDSAPGCNDSKPGSAPTLLSASPNGSNEVTLTWSKAKDPVTYYLLAFGLSSGNLQYGNPNIGGAGTTSYIVKGLSGGTTYYFKVRAGNGCMPGDYSNEISITPGGTILSSPVPSEFIEGVLGAKTEEKQIEEGLPVITKEVLLEQSLFSNNLIVVAIPVSFLVILAGSTYLVLKRKSI